MEEGCALRCFWGLTFLLWLPPHIQEAPPLALAHTQHYLGPYELAFSGLWSCGGQRAFTSVVPTAQQKSGIDLWVYSGKGMFPGYSNVSHTGFQLIPAYPEASTLTNNRRKKVFLIRKPGDVWWNHPLSHLLVRSIFSVLEIRQRSLQDSSCWITKRFIFLWVFDLNVSKCMSRTCKEEEDTAFKHSHLKLRGLMPAMMTVQTVVKVS